MDIAKFRRKSERYDLWFDIVRRRILEHTRCTSLEKVVRQLDESNWRLIVVQSYLKHFNLDERERFVDYATKASSSKQFALQLNNNLPIPISPCTESKLFLHNFIDKLNQHQELIKRIPGNFYTKKEVCGLNDELDDEVRRNLYLGAAIDQVIGVIPNYLSYGNTELMIMDSDLAERVIDSKCDELLTAEDLTHLPFKQLIVEFTKPVCFATFDATKYFANAVGFYNGSESGTYAVVWYTTIKTSLSFVNICACFMASTHGYCRVSLDHEFLVDLGFKEDIKSIRLFLDRGRPDLIDKHLDLRTKIADASKNMWDLITSRSIDYEYHKRGPSRMLKSPKHQHAQGANSTSPREFKILKLNRNVKFGDHHNQNTQLIPGYSEHVPGTFHTWCFCRSCSRVHRHDLIAKPCRRCGMIVGPISNIEVRKYWHSDYWRGQGPARQVVRGVVES